MLTLASRTALIRSIERARNVTLIAYVLPRGAVFEALAAAARRGARVRVRLDGRPYYDAAGGMHRRNEATVKSLRGDGVDAKLADEDGAHELHVKAAIVDAKVYLDDVNFGAEGTIVRDTSARDAAALRAALAGRRVRESQHFSARKDGALGIEAALLRRARCGAIVETEAAGRGNGVWNALARLGREGLRPRLLVARRTLGEKERTSLERLARDGVCVRVCSSNEKFAVCGDGVWAGSANATSAYETPNQIDWGVGTRSTHIAARLRARFDARWQRAAPLIAQRAMRRSGS
ncbi:MAG: phospholipase D-like domain-containing protein [Candidatus Tyrphobacter sp.]